jgi:2-dehydro-3-deoxygluconokinase
MTRFVCFGELLLRLASPPGELLLQTPTLIPTLAGAEANVAVSLARLGDEAAVVTVLPDNALGRAAREELRRYGVDVRGVRTGEGRMGLFFLTPGAVLRPSEVLYDRADSAFARGADAIDWDAALEGADWLHVSGVTPAIGPKGAAGAEAAAEAAVRRSVKVSFDGNYRAKLWALWDGDGPAILRSLIEAASLAFVNDQDVGLILGRSFDDPDPEERATAAARAAFEAFPRLETIAHTFRKQHAVAEHALSAALYTRDGGRWEAGPHELVGIVDRIGGGDAFAAGLLHAHAAGEAPQAALDFALAAAALKHGIAGDFNLSSEADVRALAAGAGLSVRR